MWNLRSLISKVVAFLFVDIWRFRLTQLKGKRTFFIRNLRILLLAIRGFDENKCQLRATALTFFSLLSIVPLAAMAFVTARAMGIEDVLQRQLLAEFAGYENIIQKIIGFARALLESTHGGPLTFVGALMLCLSVLAAIGHLQTAFNEIWDDLDRRSLSQKLLDYAVLMLIAPFVVIVSSSATIFLTTQFNLIVDKFSLIGWVSPLFFLGLKLMPYLLVWMLFAFIYLFIPRTTVSLRSGIWAGIVAGTIYQLVHWAFIIFQVEISRYNAIYGSFAALPLLLIWLQISWLTVLFGAELAFAHQHQAAYEFEADCLNISLHFKRLLSIYVAHFFVRHHLAKGAPLSAEKISEALDIPYRLVSHIVHDLTDCGFLDRTIQDEKTSHYELKEDAERFTIASLVDALEQNGVNRLPVLRNDHYRTLAAALEGFQAEIKSSTANRRLMDI